MATSLISPGVETNEIDLTTIVPSVSTTECALAGVFRWGPVDQRVLIDSEVQLARRFGKPTNLNYETWFTGSSTLAYGNKLWVARVGNTAGVSPIVTANVVAGNTTVVLSTGNTSALVAGMLVLDASANGLSNGAVINSVVNTTAFTVTAASAALTNTTAESIQFYSNTLFSAVGNTAAVANLAYATITNETDWTSKDGNVDTDVKWIARYPGDVGNSLRISVCGNSAGFSSTLNLASYGTAADLAVNTNSNTANLSVLAATNAAASANATTVAALLQTTDLIKVGNTSVGEQYLKVTAIDTQATYGVSSNTYELTSVAGNTQITANNTTGLAAGMQLSAGNTAFVGRVINVVTNSTSFSVDAAIATTVAADVTTISPRTSFKLNFEDRFTLATNFSYTSSNTTTRTFNRYWEFYNFVDVAPGQSTHQLNFGNTSAQDEIHVVVSDENGVFTGVPGSVLETYQALSFATDSKNVDGTGNYYKDVINDQSQYVWAVNDISGFASNTAAQVVSSTLDVSVIDLQFGNDGTDESNIEIGEVTGGYDLFRSPEDIADISLILQGKARGTTLANYLIDNIAEVRKDCIVMISPQRGDVVNNPNNELAAVTTFRNTLRSTSYGVIDSGYKYMYDRYNDLYRYVPMNGDTAGLCVRTDRTNDPWFSPAGFNRGQVKNLVRLSWNPRQADRDELYKNGINPVVTFPGQGTVLFGDKTMLSKPSAFDRINVRRLFIVLEKAISRASKYTLFEFNDEFTRLQFKNLVVPYLRDIQGRRGITDFLVVCDDTNNTPTVVDRNEFIGDIYIKPARSINFITLNFVAVPTGVSFSEVVGSF